MPLPAANDARLVARIPRPLLSRLDEHAEKLQRERPGSNVTRADAVREILVRVLETPPK